MSTDDHPVSTSAKPSLTPRGQMRRRLTQAGLGASGVLWTLNSRAQMSPLRCMAPSAGVSGKLSSNYDENLSCAGGLSPGYWKNHDGWPCARDKMFHSVFTSTGNNVLTYGSKSILALLQGCDFDRQNNSIGKHLVATYLNVLSENVTFLSVDLLREIWRQIDTYNCYTVSPTVVWTVEETKKYLEGTYHSSHPDDDSNEGDGGGGGGNGNGGGNGGGGGKPDKPGK